MANTGKIILGVTSIALLGVGVYLVIKKGLFKKKGSQLDNIPSAPETSSVSTPTSYKGVDITRGGTYLPTKAEFEAWKKDNPFSYDYKTLTQMLKGTNWLKVGEQVPIKATSSTSSSTASTSTYGVDPSQLAKYKSKYG